MEKLKMHTPDLADENFKKLTAMFPNAVTETITGYDDKGEPIIERAIDADVLRQEISATVVEGPQERYQFTWPDKKKSVVLANQPIAKTLRLDQEKSVGRNGTPGSIDTENIYIEGDNLDALKLLQETYLGKVKLIYIDPPYNTGSDFIYEDDFSQSAADYADNSGQTDEEGNRLVQNAESNGRFHTDWLNMLYPRLRIAKDLLSDDGIIFISIDDNEIENLKKICIEIFGAQNFLTCITRSTGTPTGGGFEGLVNELDYVVVCAKNVEQAKIYGLPMDEESAKIYDQQDDYGRYLIRPLRRTGGEDRREDRPTMYFPITAPDGTPVYPIGPTGYESRWICSPNTAKKLEENHLLAWKKTERMGKEVWQVYQKFYLENRTKAPGNLWTDVEGNKKATRDIRDLFDSNKVFYFPKPVGFIEKIIRIATKNDDIILDFFSGSATTAHAVMKLNAEEGTKRKYILVQLSEEADDKSEAYKSGYKTICDIGEERIRRAGKKIKQETGADIDYGFRCFRVDSSNMKDVYYRPADIGQMNLDQFTDNIKEDRKPDDLLIQVMLDLGVLLSSMVEQTEIAGKKVFSVADGYLIACFDKNVTEDVVTAIAKQKPFYAVFRDSSMANDSVAANFEQIFDTYSPQTVRKVL